MIYISIFTLVFSLYALISLIIYFTASSTTLAWLIYIFSILPVYAICIVYFIYASFRNPRKKIQFRAFLLFPIITTQILTILSSPANCYGWSQGRACYSLIQTYLSHADLKIIQDGPPHWTLVESSYPFFLLLNLTAMVVFSGTTKTEKA